MTATLIRKDGALYVRHGIPLDHRPEMAWRYYPISEDRSCGRLDRAIAESVPLADQTYTGRYSLDLSAPTEILDRHRWAIGRDITGPRLLVVLMHNGRTEPAWIEEEPIAPPRIRGRRTPGDLRWHLGRWERLTKKGWVAT